MTCFLLGSTYTGWAVLSWRMRQVLKKPVSRVVPWSEMVKHFRPLMVKSICVVKQTNIYNEDKRACGPPGVDGGRADRWGVALVRSPRDTNHLRASDLTSCDPPLSWSESVFLGGAHSRAAFNLIWTNGLTLTVHPKNAAPAHFLDHSEWADRSRLTGSPRLHCYSTQCDALLRSLSRRILHSTRTSPLLCEMAYIPLFCPNSHSFIKLFKMQITLNSPTGSLLLL